MVLSRVGKMVLGRTRHFGVPPPPLRTYGRRKIVNARAVTNNEEIVFCLRTVLICVPYMDSSFLVSESHLELY